MPKKNETVEIPVALLKLLMAEPEDLRKPEDYHNIREVAKASANLLIKMG